MRYLLQVETIAGTITLGPFATITEARHYAAGIRGQIIELHAPPADLAKLQAAGTREAVTRILDKLPAIP